MSKLDINTYFKSKNFILDINCSLNFSDGLIGLCGPSGSGKSLLLRIIAGLEEESKGKVIFNNIVFQDQSKKIFLNTSQRKAIIVFQENRLFSNLKVKDNILFGYRRNKNKNKENIDFDDLIDRLKIRYLLSREVNDLSGGEMQRVSIARSLLADKSILLLDEPLSAQDIDIKTEIISLIRDVASKLNIPIILVSHSMDDLLRLANKTILIESGRIKVFDDTKKVLSNFHINNNIIDTEPSNLLECFIQNHDYNKGLTYINLNNSLFIVPIIKAKIRSQILVRILSKDIIISKVKPDSMSIRNILKATIIKISIADKTFVDIVCSFGKIEITSRITNLSFEELNLKPNEIVYLLIKTTMIEKII